MKINHQYVTGKLLTSTNPSEFSIFEFQIGQATSLKSVRLKQIQVPKRYFLTQIKISMLLLLINVLKRNTASQFNVSMRNVFGVKTLYFTKICKCNTI